MATATIGHNRSPDPFEAFKMDLDDLFDEAKNFLDGQPIADQQQADDVSALVNRLRKSIGGADEYRKAEKKPHDDAAAAVQAKWLPTISKAKLALETAKTALARFLAHQEAEQRAAAQALQEEAKRQAEAAAQAAQQARPDDLAGQTTARVLQENAAAAQKAAQRADKVKVQATGGERAVGLRKATYRAEITDILAFGKWAWEHRRGEYLTFLDTLAQLEAKQPRPTPGITFHENERKAV
jgi:hypothetical protein